MGFRFVKVWKIFFDFIIFKETNQQTNKHSITSTQYSTSTVAASTTQPQVSQFYFEGHGHLIPHPAKKQKGGEDRFVISESMLAVFDGVSGWASHGVDPAAYPTSLAKFVEEYLKSDKDKRNKGFAFR